MAKAVISSTYDDLYLWNLPLVTWAWNRLGVDVICFVPQLFRDGKSNYETQSKIDLINRIIIEQNLNIRLYTFECPEHKEATYAQCLRNYAACLDLPENEVLITSDVDMLLLQLPFWFNNTTMTVIGSDLVPNGQFPQCYIVGDVSHWREAFNLNGKTYQQAIDELLGEDECEHYRGNRWSVDQEQSFLNISKVNHNLIPRAKEGTQWATRRYDRDDSYILDRLNPDTIDYHLNRPGYEEKNFAIIMEVLKYHFPQEDFTWLRTYNEQYKKLL
jgi:hypothetical protein